MHFWCRPYSPTFSPSSFHFNQLGVEIKTTRHRPVVTFPDFTTTRCLPSVAALHPCGTSSIPPTALPDNLSVKVPTRAPPFPTSWQPTNFLPPPSSGPTRRSGPTLKNLVPLVLSALPSGAVLTSYPIPSSVNCKKKPLRTLNKLRTLLCKPSRVMARPPTFPRKMNMIDLSPLKTELPKHMSQPHRSQQPFPPRLRRTPPAHTLRARKAPIRKEVRTAQFRSRLVGGLHRLRCRALIRNRVHILSRVFILSKGKGSKLL